MSNIKVKLNTGNIGKFLNSEEVKALVEEQAQAVMQRAGTEGYEIDTVQDHGRVKARVYTTDRKAYFKELKSNNLLKAVQK